MSFLSLLTLDIYSDHRRTFDYEVVSNTPQLERIVDDIARDAFDPCPDPAAPIVAARLLHDLVTLRRHIFFNQGPAWALVETYLLIHGFDVIAPDEEIATLLDSIRERRVDTVQALGFMHEALRVQA